jgi:GNAT superfamily N-acetyltransferase
MRVVTLADDPALAPRMRDHSAGVWPEYNQHGVVPDRYWHRLGETFPAAQFGLLDGDELLVVAHAAPVAWDGTIAGLPAGVDGALERAFALPKHGSALCALAIEVRTDARSRGLSRRALEAMREITAAHGFEHLIAPVRPSLKERYPITPIEQYATWRRPDGLPFDPWMRVHERLGAFVLRAEPRSLLIDGTVEEWEEWTGMAFPAPGEYVFPHGLAPVRIEGGRGTYYEPNVWMQHSVQRAGSSSGSR